MKWPVLLIFIGLVPILQSWLQNNHRLAPRIWMLMGFLPFVMGSWHLIIAPISWAMWPGYVKGAEVSLLDAIALAVVLSRPKTRIQPIFKFIFLFYIFAALVSVAFSDVPQGSLFYAWQLARVFLVFVAVASICTDERGPQAIILGMVAGVCLQLFYAVEEKLAGVTQASGTFGHQNLLGMITHFVAFPALALLLVDGKSKAPFWGVVSAALLVILGASRATIGLAAFGYASLMLLSIIRKPTSRKTGIVMMGILALAVAAPFALSSLNNRFEAAPVEGDYDERAAFEKAAKLIFAEHPMGVGANQYVIVSNTKGYSERAGVIWTPGSRSANVHNTYLLMAAEMGYLGLAAFVLLLVLPIIVALRGAWRNRHDKRGDIVLGIGMTLIVVALHCFYEWIFVNYAVQILLAMDLGIMAGLLQQISASDKTKRSRGEGVSKPDRGDPAFAL